VKIERPALLGPRRDRPIAGQTFKGLAMSDARYRQQPTHRRAAKAVSRTQHVDLGIGMERAAFFLGVLIFIIAVLAVRTMMAAPTPWASSSVEAPQSTSMVRLADQYQGGGPENVAFSHSAPSEGASHA
jgi:hypothetical protein